MTSVCPSLRPSERADVGTILTPPPTRHKCCEPGLLPGALSWSVSFKAIPLLIIYSSEGDERTARHGEAEVATV